MINIPSTFRISFRALKVNKMRSALTMLGIIIGVGAVITMLAVGTGASRRISEQIASMGSNLLMVLPGSTTSGGVRMGAGTQPTLTLGDAEAIQKECASVQDVAPVQWSRTGHLWTSELVNRSSWHESQYADCQGLAACLR